MFTKYYLFVLPLDPNCNYTLKYGSFTQFSQELLDQQMEHIKPMAHKKTMKKPILMNAFLILSVNIFKRQ